MALFHLGKILQENPDWNVSNGILSRRLRGLSFRGTLVEGVRT
jgi:hypothetical protein